MRIGRTALAFALAVVVGGMAGQLRAQEFTLPPAPSSSTEKDGTAFLPEHGPCFYNPYSWMVAGRFNQTLLAAEMQDLASGWGRGSSSAGCLGHYALTSYDLFGTWGYMLADGVRRPKSPPRAKVVAAWEASRKAAAGEARGPTQPTPTDLTPPDEPQTRTARTGHEAVPALGDGYGSAALVSRSLRFRVAPAPAPATYDGIPIVERDRAWERVETPDGRRVWRETALPPAGYRGSAGLAARRQGVSGQERFGDRGIQRQEGMSRRPSYSSGAAPRASSSASSSSSSRPTSPMVGKKNRKQ